MTVAIDTFRVLSAFTSTVMLLSPIPMIYGVYKVRSTGVMSIVPLVSMLAHSNTTLVYGYLTEHYFPIVSTFLFGDLLCLSYIAIFYHSSHEKAKAHKVFIVYGIPLTLLSIYGFLGGYGVTDQTRHEAGNVFGYAGIVTNLVLYSSHFEKIALVLKHRSAVFFNIHMVCAGVVNTSVWVVYTALTKQWIIMGPSSMSVTMGLVQIALYLIFHPSTHPYTGPLPGSEQKPEQVDVEAGETMQSPTKLMGLTSSPHFIALNSPSPHVTPQ